MEKPDMAPSTACRRPQPSKVVKRRANSCKPCRDSKSKCSGGIPCTTCQKKRQKPRCYYLNSFSRESDNDDVVQDTSAGRSRREPTERGARQEMMRNSSEDIPEEDSLSGPHEDFYGMLSLARSVDEFKRLLPAEGPFQDLIDSIQPVQVFSMETERAESPSSPQPVSIEHTAKVSELSVSPQLQRLFLGYHSVRSLLTAGQATQAWSKFASLVRDAEMFGLKETAKVMTPESPEETQHSRRLWWLIMEIDFQLSFLLGQRPCLASSYGVPKPMLEDGQGEVSDSREDIFDFTAYMVDLLNRINQDQEKRAGYWEARKAKLQTELTQLRQIHSRLPRLPQGGLPDTTLSAFAQHQVDVQCALMVLYCQLLRAKNPENTKSGRLRNQREPAAKSYYRELVKSLRAVIDIFDYSYRLDPTTTTSSWSRCFGMFCAASMLGIARLRQEVDVDTDNDRIETALGIFAALADTRQAVGLAQMAADALNDILEGIRELENTSSGSRPPLAASSLPTEATQSSETVSEGTIPQTHMSGPKDQSEAPSLKRIKTSSLEEETRPGKRLRVETDPVKASGDSTVSAWEGGQYSQAMAYEQITTTPVQGSGGTQNYDQQPYPSSAATSFNDQLDFYETGYLSTHPTNFGDYHPDHHNHWVHPPMLYTIPLYDNWLQHQFQADEDIPSGMNTQQVFYRSPVLPPMDQMHGMGTAMHDAQHTSYVPMPQSSPTHPQTMMIPASHDMHQASGAPGVALPPAHQQQAPMYSSSRSGAPGQTLSSPREPSSQLQGNFPAPAAADRRRSLADIRQQQLENWKIEQSPQQSGPRRRVRHASVSRGTIPSPPNVTASQSYGQVTQSQSSGGFPASSRLPTARMEGSVISPTHDNVQQRRPDLQQQSQGHYEMRGHSPFNLTMTNEGVLDFSQQLQYHQHLPANNVVTTGPFHGDGQGHRWGWSG